MSNILLNNNETKISKLINAFNENTNNFNNNNNTNKNLNVFTLVIEPNIYPINNNTALEDQQRLTKDLEERRAKAEHDRIQLERERIEAEKKASQIADIANEEKVKMVILQNLKID